jgi:hypothetical protein
MMVTKRVSSGVKTTRRKATAPSASALSDSAALGVLETAQGTAISRSVDPDDRRRMVAAEAYFRAERRGFAAGKELEDWVAAEVVVDSRLQQTQVA